MQAWFQILGRNIIDQYFTGRLARREASPTAYRTLACLGQITGGIAGDPGFASETLRAHDAIEMSDLVTLSSLLC